MKNTCQIFKALAGSPKYTASECETDEAALDCDGGASIFLQFSNFWGTKKLELSNIFILENASYYRHPKGGLEPIISSIFKYHMMFGWLPAYAMPCPGTLYELTAHGRQLRGLCSGASFLSDDFCHFQRRRHMEIWEKPLKRALSFLTFDDMVILNHPLEVYFLWRIDGTWARLLILFRNTISQANWNLPT